MAINTFPELVWELETHLGINWKSNSIESYISLDRDETPFTKTQDAIEYFETKSNSGELNEDSMAIMFQEVTMISFTLPITAMHSNAHKNAVLVPSKSNYLGIGESRFLELMKMVTNINMSKREDINKYILNELELILSNEQLQGSVLNLETRVMILIYSVLSIMNDRQTASFLAQYITIQDSMTKERM